MTLFRNILYIIALAFLSGCASYDPIVDENEKNEEVGEEVAERVMMSLAGSSRIQNN